MVAFKLLVAAALACVVVAHDHPTDTACVAPVTVTVTETVCGTPGVPVHTPPVASYEVPPPPPAPPVTSIESTATAPVSGPPASTATDVPPAPPAESGVPPVGIPPVPTTAVVPSTGVAPSSAVKTSVTSVTVTSATHSSAQSTKIVGTSTTLRPSEVSTAGAVLAMPTAYLGLGSLFAAGAAAMAVIA